MFPLFHEFESYLFRELRLFHDFSLFCHEFGNFCEIHEFNEIHKIHEFWETHGTGYRMVTEW